jgi:hypothetical protein
MRRAAICAVVSLALAAHAFAILRPRYPVRTRPPFGEQIIIIGGDSIGKTAKSENTPAQNKSAASSVLR